MKDAIAADKLIRNYTILNVSAAKSNTTSKDRPFFGKGPPYREMRNALATNQRIEGQRQHLKWRDIGRTLRPGAIVPANRGNHSRQAC